MRKRTPPSRPQRLRSPRGPRNLRSAASLSFSKLRIGGGSHDTADSPVDLDPLVTRTHLDKVINYLDLGQKQGAELVVDGCKTGLPAGR